MPGVFGNTVTGCCRDSPRYGVTRLVWFRAFDDIEIAIAEEKRIKRWRRAWKIQMIEQMNPEWEDLYANIV